MKKIQDGVAGTKGRFPTWLIWLTGVIVVLFGGLTAYVVFAGEDGSAADDTEHITEIVPNEGAELAEATAAYCEEHGQFDDVYGADRDDCLMFYWTYDRLKDHPDHTELHAAKTREMNHCAPTEDGGEQCTMMGLVPPGSHDPYWEELAVADPARVEVEPSDDALQYDSTFGEPLDPQDTEAHAPILEYPMGTYGLIEQSSAPAPYPWGSYDPWPGLREFCEDAGYSAEYLAENTEDCLHEWFTPERIAEREIPITEEGLSWWTQEQRWEHSGLDSDGPKYSVEDFS